MIRVRPTVNPPGWANKDPDYTEDDTVMKRMTTNVEADEDLLNGVSEIAAFIRRNKRRTNYLITTGRIPTTKLGPRTIVASKRRIERALKGE
jgi:hypothetical protein